MTDEEMNKGVIALRDYVIKGINEHREGALKGSQMFKEQMVLEDPETHHSMHGLFDINEHSIGEHVMVEAILDGMMEAINLSPTTVIGAVHEKIWQWCNRRAHQNAVQINLSDLMGKQDGENTEDL